MSGYYGIVFDGYWTGPTGRAIQRLGGKDAALLGLYLSTNGHANMIGLYRLPPDTITHETPLGPAALAKALDVLAAVDFAYYDAVTEHVWVREMARFRLGLRDDRPRLDPDDKRVIGVRKLYHGIDENPFLEPFFTRYQSSLHLSKMRSSARYPLPVALSSPIQAPSEAPSKPLASQDQGTYGRSRDQRSGTGNRIRKNKPPRKPRRDARPVENRHEPKSSPAADGTPSAVRDRADGARGGPGDQRRGVEGADEGDPDGAGLGLPDASALGGGARAGGAGGGAPTGAAAAANGHGAAASHAAASAPAADPDPTDAERIDDVAAANRDAIDRLAAVAGGRR